MNYNNFNEETIREKSREFFSKLFEGLDILDVLDCSNIVEEELENIILMMSHEMELFN